MSLIHNIQRFSCLKSNKIFPIFIGPSTPPWTPHAGNQAIPFSYTTPHQVYTVSPEEIPQLQKIIEMWQTTCTNPPNDRLNDCSLVLQELSEAIHSIQQSGSTNSTLWIAVNKKQKVISIAHTMIRLSEQHIIHLISSPEHLLHPQNHSMRGGGTAIIQAIEQSARKAGVTQLAADTRLSAEDFYRKQGFLKERYNSFYTKRL